MLKVLGIGCSCCLGRLSSLRSLGCICFCGCIRWFSVRRVEALILDSVLDQKGIDAVFNGVSLLLVTRVYVYISKVCECLKDNELITELHLYVLGYPLLTHIATNNKPSELRKPLIYGL